MLNSSLLEILRTFNPDEIKKFEDFILSPYFNKKAGVIKLYSEIKKYFPDFKNENLKREIVWKKLFPDRKFNYGIMKNLIFDLHKLTENFLQVLNFEFNEINKSNRLLIELMRRKLDRLFEKEAKETKKLLNKSKVDTVYFQNKHLFDSVYQSYFFNNKISIERYNHIREFNSSLMEFFFSAFFNRNAALAVDKLDLNLDFDKDSVKTVTDFFNVSPSNTKEDVLVYYYDFEIAEQRNNYEAFKKFKDLIGKNYSRYTKRQQYNFYTGLIEFCYHNLENDLLSKSEIFEVCKSMLEKGLHTNDTNKYMNQFLYLGIADAVLSCKEFEWTKKFIEDYKEKLNPEIRENFYDKALIKYFIEAGEFENALEKLSTIKFTSPRDKFDTKIFQFKIYYELNDVEGLSLLIDSSRHYIAKDKHLSDVQKKSFLKFTGIMKKLVSIKSEVNTNDNTEMKIEDLRKEILSEEPPEKKWLYMKIEELKAENSDKKSR